MEAILFILLGGALVLALGFAKRRFMSFLSQSPDDYVSQGPDFDLRRHLNGPIQCEGVIYGPTGRVTSRFVGDFDTSWQGNRGVMREHFRYDSGNTQDREWALELDGEGRIRATAPDVIGVGEGRQSGSAVQLRYRIQLPESAGSHVLDVVDWMYLAPNGTIVNRSQFRKFGIQVAELVATMRPLEAQLEKRDAA
ncbi:DUF3833 domain-containing protein [Ruegeria sp. 2012CJ41-6]|uniref:DUF3833 domain-containing protein n=1 Tax=Ruegeria spongiae TaxID=2942209 RepID=A0ABT0Q1J2_9RHOB|nr:DUF3833 domain-containing protein [Ruegeria spongiae]MCL6283672.1 DUF3833 domain-containing protein [Ruegeria spongiae]